MTGEMSTTLLPVNAAETLSSVTQCHAKPRAVRREGKPQRHDVKIGNVTVPIYVNRYRRLGGKVEVLYCVSYYEEGRRIRRNFASLPDARRFAEKQARGIEKGEREAARWGGDDALAFGTAKSRVSGVGLSVIEVCRQFVAATKRLPEGSTLVEAVGDFAARFVRTEKRTIAEVIAEFIEAKKQVGCSETYLRTIRTQLAPNTEGSRTRNSFGSAFGSQFIAGVSTSAIEEWLHTRAPGLRARKNFLVPIRTLFSFARSKGCLARNQPTAADDVPMPRIRAADEIPIFTPEEMARMLNGSGVHCPTQEAIVFLALGAFAGLRTAEILRLEWSDIQLGTGYIVVRAKKAKTGRRRLIPILPNLAEWLRPLAKADGRLFVAKRAEVAIHDYARAVGVPWQANGLRHSFISYRVAQTQDLAKVALEAGNSPAICERNYRELVTREVAAKWFEIVPAISNA